MQRRLFLKSTLGASLLFTATSKANKEPIKALKNSNEYLIARTTHSGQHQVATISIEGEILTSFDVPSRQHSFAINSKKNQIISVGRRPSKYIVIADVDKDASFSVTAKQGRHFYGHGVFCKDQRFLYTTENDYAGAKGVIGVRDSENEYKQVAEFPSYGVGPHQILLSKDKNIIFVANGGVATHPQSGRKKLNLDVMQSNLAMIDAHSKQLIERISLPEIQRQNSIRHFAMKHDGQLILALQNQALNKRHEVLLAQYHLGSEKVEKIAIPFEIQMKLNSYIGDVVFDSSSQFFAASAPKGNHILIYKSSGEFMAALEITDACGLNATNNEGEFLVATGLGEIMFLSKHNQWQPENRQLHRDSKWDNHMIIKNNLFF